MRKLVQDAAPKERVYEYDEPFHALVQSICHQQVSIHAGRAIGARVDATSGKTPDGVLRAGPEKLRAAGLSRPKVAYVLDLAQKTRDKEVDFTRVGQMGDEEIIEMLTGVKGIGVWTAKMFLIFHMARPDVSAHEDLGIVLAVEQAYHVPRKRAGKKVQAMRDAWAPYNSLAMLTLWNSR